MRILLSLENLQKLKPTDKPYDTHCSKYAGLMVRTYPTGKKIYYAEWGRGRRKKLGEFGGPTLKQVRLLCQSVMGDVADARKDGRTPDIEKRRGPNPTLREYLKQDYEPWALQNRATGAQTVARIKACFGAMLDRKLPDITPWLLEKWRTGRLKAGIAKPTINRDVVALKAALSKAVAWGIITENPIAPVKPYKVDRQGRVRFLDATEIAALKNALRERDARIRQDRLSANEWRARRGYVVYPVIPPEGFGDYLTPLVITALHSGARRGELLALKWEKVNFYVRQIEIAGDEAKNAQTRFIPMNDEALDTLIRWRRQAPSKVWVFATSKGARLLRVDKSFGAVVKAAGIKDCTLHTLRHSFASRLVQAGVSFAVVRELMGHQSLEMTLKYSHLARGAKAEAVARLVDG